MNVCLIAPPAVRIRYNISGVHPLPPLGLAYIAAVLEKENFNVEIIDMVALKMSLRQLEGYLKNRHFDIYGITCNVFNLKCGMDIGDLIKRVDSRSLVVLGGRCAAFPSADIFERCNSFDVIVRGEGEMTMLELCNLLKSNPKNLDGLSGIKGLAFKKSSQSIDIADREYLDFDSLPFPARHLLPNNRYRMHPPFGIHPPLAIMETSRGCVYKCNFCGLFTSLRERSVPNIISEIEQLISKYKIKELHFVDPNFTYNQERLRNFCNALIKNKFDLAWSCKTRVDLVNPDLLGLMEKSGCYMISYGVESATQDRLDGLDKEITVNNTVDAFNWTRRHKIRSIAYVIIGYSEESDDSIGQLTAFINKINPDFVLYNEFLYVPGTPIVKQLIKEGKITYKDLMDFYVSGKSINIPRTKVAKYLSKANRSFYFRIDYIFLRLMQIKNFQDFVNMLNGFRYFIFDKIRLKNIF